MAARRGGVETPDRTVRERLIEAADLELAEYGTLTARFESVARRAGVSRATAYRQLGSVGELMTQVGLRRSHVYISRLREVMDREQGVLAKLEASLIYGAEALPDEPLVLALVARQFSQFADPEVHGLIYELIGPMLEQGQRSGDIRNDVDLDVVIGYLVEQSYLATHASDRSAAAVRKRFRLFVVPAITPSAMRCEGGSD